MSAIVGSVVVVVAHVAIGGGGGGVGRVKGRLVAALRRLRGGHVVGRGEFEGAGGKMGGGSSVSRRFHERVDHGGGGGEKSGGGVDRRSHNDGWGCVLGGRERD